MFDTLMEECYKFSIILRLSKVIIMKKIIFASLVALLLVSCHRVTVDDYNYSVASPAGAPGIALAQMASRNPAQYTFVDAETIATVLSKGEDDFVIAPVNAGAKLFKAGKSSYQLAAVVTWGNLYFASQKSDFVPADIAQSKDVYFFGENTINSSIARYVLEKNNIKIPENITYLGSAANTQTTLLQKDSSIVLTAEPLVTAASMKNPKVTSHSVQALYKEITGNEGFVQAGLFVNPKTSAEHPEVVKRFLDELKVSCEAVSLNLDEVSQKVVDLQLLGNVQIAKKAIPGCNIKYVAAKDARPQLELTASIDLAQFGGVLPSDEFYYSK